MHMSALILTLVFEFIIIVGVSWVLTMRRRRLQSEHLDFATANRGLPAIAIAATQALTCLGGGHIMGMPGAASAFGISAIYYLIASAIMIVLMMVVTGPWIRRFGFSNIPDMFEKMFDKRTAIMISAFCAGSCFGVLTCETQGVGSVVAALSGSTIALGCVIGGVLGLLYVLFGGMEEVGWVNVINAIFMYVGAFIALALIGGAIPGGWATVNQHFVDAGETWKLSLGANPDTWRWYIVGTFVSGLFNQAVAGQSGQITASAKNVKALRRAACLAVPMNMIFGVIMIALYMGATCIGDYTSIPGSPGYQNMLCLVNELPTWASAWIMAAMAAAMLSTIAVQLLTLSTIFVQTIYCRYYKKNATAAEQNRYLRIGILIIFVLGTLMATTLPEISAAMVWLFAWLLPGFWIFMLGIFWRRSKSGAFGSLVICGLFNCVWSFTSLPSVFHLEGNNNSIGLLVVSVFVYAIWAALDKNAEGPFKEVYLHDRNNAVADDLIR